MNKIYLLLLLLTYTSICLSQQSGKIEYEFSYLKHNYDSKDPSVVNSKKMADLVAEYATQHRYILKYNKNESNYQVDASMPLDGMNEFAHKFSKQVFANGVFYQNNQTKEVLNELNSMSQSFLVKDSIYKNWKLTSENKYIGKYLCYKATLECNSCSKNQIVTAWYTPKIPSNFGPAGYGGLPGLVLEVSKFRYTLSAKKIKFLTTELKIQKPTKGKVISREGLKKLQLQARANY